MKTANRFENAHTEAALEACESQKPVVWLYFQGDSFCSQQQEAVAWCLRLPRSEGHSDVMSQRLEHAIGVSTRIHPSTF